MTGTVLSGKVQVNDVSHFLVREHNTPSHITTTTDGGSPSVKTAEESEVYTDVQAASGECIPGRQSGHVCHPVRPCSPRTWLSCYSRCRANILDSHCIHHQDQVFQAGHQAQHKVPW